MNNRLKHSLTLIAAATAFTAAAAPFDRDGLIVPYAEDHFPDIASMRYDRSPFYRAIEAATDSATIAIPPEWKGKRIVVGVGYPSDTYTLPELTINGERPGQGVRPLRWDVTSSLKASGAGSITLRGIGRKPRRVYAYATPTRVYVDRYHIVSRLDSTDLDTGLFDLDIDLGGIKKRDPSVAVEYMLFDASRHQVAAGRAEAAPHLRFKARIPAIHRWSTDDPYRYMLAIILLDDRSGQHIMTVGSPMRFANYTAREGEGPVLNNVAMQPLALAQLDSIPSSPDERRALSAALRAAGANAVIAPAGYDPDTDWRNFCADDGILCYADGSLDAMTLFAADPAEAERPQQPDGFARMARRYARVHTELADTSTVTIAATTRSPFAPLGDFALDYEIVTPEGRRLTSSEYVVTSAPARERTLITLMPPLPGHTSMTSPLPDDVPEAFLNISWRPLRPMAGTTEGVVSDRAQFVIGSPAKPAPLEAQKIKQKKGVWRARKTELEISSVSGLPVALAINGKPMLTGPVSITIDGMSTRARAASVHYDSKTRSITADISLDNPVSDLPVGSVRLAYRIGRDNEVEIRMLQATPGTALSFDSPGDRIYLGRGPDDSQASEWVQSRIAIYSSRPTPQSVAHAETRYFILRDKGLDIRLENPAVVTFRGTRAHVSMAASSLRLKSISQSVR